MKNPDLIDLKPCLCESQAAVMRFELNRWAAVCQKCHRHGKTENSLKQASIKWNEQIEKLVQAKKKNNLG